MATGKPSELFSNLVKIPELRKRLVFTLIALCIYRVGWAVPVPGIDHAAFTKAFADQISGSWAEGLLGIYNTLSAGSIMQFTIFSLGIMPYISAEIIFQLLTKVVPSLEELSKEGEQGRRKLKQYSRYMTLGICVVQALFVTNLLIGGGGGNLAATLRLDPFFFTITTVITMTAGTFFLIFLADKITEKGLGNGVSLIIQAGILASIPQTLIKLAQPMLDPNSSPSTSVEYFIAFVLLIAMFVAVTYGIVQITLGRREIPIQHAKHTRGQAGGPMQRQQTIPLKVDQAGVIPIIFASALLVFPTMAFSTLGEQAWLGGFFSKLFGDIGSAYGAYGWIYEMSYVGLIFFFTYFWTQLTFSPTELAKNMRDWGAYIPGVRPGADTVNHLTIILKRMTLAGAIFLSLVAVIPNLFPHLAAMIFGDSQALTENRLFYRIIGGTGLLIVVSVALDLVQRIEAELITRSYESGDDSAATGGGGRRRRR